MEKTQKMPTKPCLCGANEWYQRADGGWSCGRCSPKPAVVYSPETIALRDRVILGNDVLFKAWLQIREFDGAEREEQLDRWNEAQEKLHRLCLELQALGYEDCLYIKDGKKSKSCISEPDQFWCQVCSSSHPYWEEELMKL